MQQNLEPLSVSFRFAILLVRHSCRIKNLRAISIHGLLKLIGDESSCWIYFHPAGTHVGTSPVVTVKPEQVHRTLGVIGLEWRHGLQRTRVTDDVQGFHSLVWLPTWQLFHIHAY